MTRSKVPVEILRRYSVTVNGETKKLRLGGKVVFEVVGRDFEVSAGIDWVNLCVWRGTVNDGVSEAVLLVEHDDILGGAAGRGRYFRITPIGGSCQGDMVDVANSSQPDVAGGRSATWWAVLAGIIVAANVILLAVTGLDSWVWMIASLALTGGAVWAVIRAATSKNRPGRTT